MPVVGTSVKISSCRALLLCLLGLEGGGDFGVGGGDGGEGFAGLQALALDGLLLGDGFAMFDEHLDLIGIDDEDAVVVGEDDVAG